MIEQHLRGRSVDPVEDEAVLDAMSRVPREEFVPERLRELAYADRPLPIGHDQTISQPYIVAKMTELLDVEAGDRVLEVGTGSGYQAAVLDALGCEVFSIEIVESLGHEAAERLQRLGFTRTRTRIGDGYRGWPEHAPFDAIVVTAAPDHVPPALIEQLAVGGQLVIPVGPQSSVQELRRITRTDDGSIEETVFAVRFVPMTGEAESGGR